MKARFPFIQKNLYLVPEVDEKTEERFLGLELVDTQSNKIILQERFSCPHTKIPESSLEELDIIKSDEEKRNDFIEQSTNNVQYEGIRTLGLKPKGVLDSMKSWVKKFAKKGIASLVEQNEISLITGIRMRFVTQIAEFLARMDPSLVINSIQEDPNYFVAFLDVFGFSWVPKKIHHNFTKIYGVYVPKDPQFIQELIQFFQDNFDLLREKDNYRFRKFIWYFRPEIIGFLINLIVKNYNIQHLSLEETIDELTPFWYLFDAEISNSISGITEKIIDTSLDFLPKELGSLIEIPPILSQLLSKKKKSLNVKILEDMVNKYHKSSKSQQRIYLKKLPNTLDYIKTSKLSPEVLTNLLNIIPIELFFEQQLESYYLWYLSFMGKHNYMSEYLQKVIQHYTNDYLISHFDQIYEILILQKYSPIFEKGYWTPNLRDAFYGNVADVDCPIYLRDSKKLFFFLLENLSLEKILEKFDFIEMIIFSEGTEFIPMILDKILRLNSQPSRDILKEDPSVNKFVDVIQKNFCIKPGEIDRIQWRIPEEIFVDTYKYLKIISYRDYEEEQYGLYFLKNCKSIFQFMKVVDLYPDWKNEFSRIFLTEELLEEDFYRTYLNFISDLPPNIQNALVELSKSVGLPIKLYNSLKSVYYENWNEDECYFDEDDEPIYYLEYPSDCEVYFVIVEDNRIEQLYIIGSQLNIIPDCIVEFQDLKILNLSDSNLTKIPEWICNLKKLEFINLSYNKFHKLPECLGKLGALEILLLHGNSIGTLMDTLGDLQNLRVLNLESNQLVEIPHCIQEMGNLRKIFLDNDLVSNEGDKRLQILRERGCEIQWYDKENKREIQWYDKK